MTISVKPVSPQFVGEVRDADLRSPLSEDDVAAIHAGMDRYGVLVFRDQRLTDDEQIAFTKNFGGIENPKAAISPGIMSID